VIAMVPDLACGSNDVHIWWIALDEIGDDALAVLSADEVERANRFRHERDRRRWMRARAALRLILARYVGLAAPDLRFRPGPWGKPELTSAARSARPAGRVETASREPRSSPRARGAEQPSEEEELTLRFSLSHARERAAIAVSWGREVGIDLEPIDEALDLPALIAATCTPAEALRIGKLPRHQRVAAFVSLWTQKEAYLKAAGTGLSRDPRTVEIDLDGHGAGAVRDLLVERGGGPLQVIRLDAGAGWAAALAAPHGVSIADQGYWPLAIVNDRAIAS
jgi:4'-phosphopantetheinyl transferase